jgi:hypothetical protein
MYNKSILRSLIIDGGVDITDPVRLRDMLHEQAETSTRSGAFGTIGGATAIGLGIMSMTLNPAGVLAALSGGFAFYLGTKSKATPTEEKEFKFLSRHGRVINLLGDFASTGSATEDEVISAYESMVQAYAPLTDQIVVAGEAVAAAEMMDRLPLVIEAQRSKRPKQEQQKQSPPAKDGQSVLKSMGEYMMSSLNQQRKAEVLQLAIESPRAALDTMLAHYGYSDTEIEEQWPGALEALGRNQPQLPTTAIQPQLAASTPIGRQSSPSAVSQKVVLDSAADLGQNPQSAIIAGVPGAGKGIFVSNALREVKRRNPHVKIFAIDPKNDPKETGYWSIADQLWRRDFDQCSTEDAAMWLMDRLGEYRNHSGPKLLVLDEGTTAFTVLKLAKVFEERELGNGAVKSLPVDMLGEFKKFLVTISGMGDSRESWVWIVCQVINCADLGLTGGVRSIFRSIALVSPKNRNAVATFFSTGFVPLPPGGKDALYEMMDNSECNRAFYDGKTDEWVPTPVWPNHSGYNRDTRQQVDVPQTTTGNVSQQMTLPVQPTPQPIAVAVKPDDDPWENTNAQLVTDPQETLAKLAAVAGVSPTEMQNLLKALSNA